MSVPPESLNADGLTRREFAIAQLRDMQLTEAERNVAWSILSSMTPDCGAHAGADSFCDGDSPTLDSLVLDSRQSAEYGR